MAEGRAARVVADRQAMRVAERVRVREIDDDEGRRLLRIIRRGTGSVVTWRRAQTVLLSAQGMTVAKIAEVTFTSALGLVGIGQHVGQLALGGVLVDGAPHTGLLSDLVVFR